MADKDVTTKVILLGDVASMVKAMSSAEQSAKQTGQAITDSFSGIKPGVDDAMEGITGAIQAMAAKATAAFAAIEVGSVIKDAVLLAARYETLGVVTQIVGKNAGYTTSEMAGFQAALQKTGISAIESRQGLALMGQAQLKMSDSTKLARIAQDAAVVGNINSSEAFNRMVTGLATGQSILLHHLGLMTNFEQAYINTAHAVGKSKDDLTENEKAQIRVNEVMRAGVGIQGSYEAALQTVGKQLTSIPRYVSDLMVQLGEMGQGPLFAGVKALTDALKFTAKNFDDITAAAEVMMAAGVAGYFGKIAVSIAATTAVKLADMAVTAAAAEMKAAEIAEELLRAQVMSAGIVIERESALARMFVVSANAAKIASEVAAGEVEVAQAVKRSAGISAHLGLIATESAALVAKGTLTKTEAVFSNELRNAEFTNRNKLSISIQEQTAAELRLNIVKEASVLANKAQAATITELAMISKAQSLATTQLTAANAANTAMTDANTVAVIANKTAQVGATAGVGMAASAVSLLAGPLGIIIPLLIAGAAAWHGYIDAKGRELDKPGKLSVADQLAQENAEIREQIRLMELTPAKKKDEKAQAASEQMKGWKKQEVELKYTLENNTYTKTDFYGTDEKRLKAELAEVQRQIAQVPALDPENERLKEKKQKLIDAKNPTKPAKGPEFTETDESQGAVDNAFRAYENSFNERLAKSQKEANDRLEQLNQSAYDGGLKDLSAYLNKKHELSKANADIDLKTKQTELDDAKKYSDLTLDRYNNAYDKTGGADLSNAYGKVQKAQQAYNSAISNQTKLVLANGKETDKATVDQLRGYKEQQASLADFQGDIVRAAEIRKKLDEDSYSRKQLESAAFYDDIEAEKALTALKIADVEKIRQATVNKQKNLDDITLSTPDIHGNVNSYGQRQQALNISVGNIDAKMKSNPELKQLKDLETEKTAIIAKSKAEQAAIQEKYDADIIQSQLGAAEKAMGIIVSAAGDNKAVQLAALVFQTGIAVAQIQIAESVAEMRAMAELGPIAGDAMVVKLKTMAAINTALTLAAGAVQAVQIAGKRAEGGSVAGGSTYLVGEKGPELFTPGSTGMIIPNHAISSGQGVTINNSYDFSNADPSTEQRMRAYVDRGNENTKAYILDNMNRGGKFALASGRLRR